MGRQLDTIDSSTIEWLGKQPVFFVGSAPTGSDGHINISPKGGRETFRVLGPTTVAYLDMTGSGIETVAHLKENGRIVVMFCAFEGPPKIVRLHGHGRVVEPGDREFGDLLARFQPADETMVLLRSIIVVDVARIGESCGFVVPRMDFVEERTNLHRWAEQKQSKEGEGWDLRYRQANNLKSIDGLTGLDLRSPESEAAVAHLSSAGRAL